MEGLTRYRTQLKKVAMQVGGHTNSTSLYGGINIAPHVEQMAFSLPVVSTYQKPIIDPVTGKRFWNPDIDGSGDTYHPRR